MYHREVVEPSCRQELVVGAEGAGWGGVVEIEVEVEDLRLLHLQFVGDEAHEQVVLFQFVGNDAEQGLHVFLFAQFHAVVHLAVEVDGEVGDLEERTADVEQACRAPP